MVNSLSENKAVKAKQYEGTPAYSFIYLGERAKEKEGLKSFLYEKDNHLGNVLATITDHKIPHNNNGTIDFYTADISSAQDYYAFGSEMPGRTFNPTASKFGYQGSLKDNEISGVDGANYTTFYRECDTRKGQWNTPDPVFNPSVSPYAMMGDNPIINFDILGNTIDPVNDDSKTGMDKNITNSLGTTTTTTNSDGTTTTATNDNALTNLIKNKYDATDKEYKGEITNKELRQAEKDLNLTKEQIAYAKTLQNMIGSNEKTGVLFTSKNTFANDFNDLQDKKDLFYNSSMYSDWEKAAKTNSAFASNYKNEQTNGAQGKYTEFIIAFTGASETTTNKSVQNKNDYTTVTVYHPQLSTPISYQVKASIYDSYYYIMNKEDYNSTNDKTYINFIDNVSQGNKVDTDDKIPDTFK